MNVDDTNVDTTNDDDGPELKVWKQTVNSNDPMNN